MNHNRDCDSSIEIEEFLLQNKINKDFLDKKLRTPIFYLFTDFEEDFVLGKRDPIEILHDL